MMSVRNCGLCTGRKERELNPLRKEIPRALKRNHSNNQDKRQIRQIKYQIGLLPEDP